MKDSLRRYGYRVSVAIDEEDALDRVSNTLSANLVLIDVVGKSVEDTCRREGAFVNGKDLEGTDENVAGRIGFSTWVKNQNNYRSAPSSYR